MSLPEAFERDALLAALAELIADHGHSDFLFGPILTPSPQHFPDPWRPDSDGAAAMLRRLLHWTRMGEVPFSMEEFEEEEEVEIEHPDGRAFLRPWHGVAAWFAGADGRKLLFGLDVGLLTSPDAVAGVLAHEVAHAWRFRHGEFVEDQGHEEHLTDVTTVFLGAGVLTCNNAERIRSSGEVHGHSATYEVKRESYGYLSPEAMAWLLAVQLAARRDEKEIDRVEGVLERNQRATLRQALALLQKDVEVLDRKLGLPSIEARLQPAPLEAPAALELPPPAARPALEPERAIGFRMPNLWGWRVFGWTLVGLVVTLVLWTWTHQPAVWAVVALAAVVGRFKRFVVCSQCETAVAAQADGCESCGARLVGDIAAGRDRHDAEERWRLSQADPRERLAMEDDRALEQEALEHAHPDEPPA